MKMTTKNDDKIENHIYNNKNEPILCTLTGFDDMPYTIPKGLKSCPKCDMLYEVFSKPYNSFERDMLVRKENSLKKS